MDLEKTDVRYDFPGSHGVPTSENEGYKGQLRVFDQYEQLSCFTYIKYKALLLECFFFKLFFTDRFSVLFGKILKY